MTAILLNQNYFHYTLPRYTVILRYSHSPTYQYNILSYIYCDNTLGRLSSFYRQDPRQRETDLPQKARDWTRPDLDKCPRHRAFLPLNLILVTMFPSSCINWHKKVKKNANLNRYTNKILNITFNCQTYSLLLLTWNTKVWDQFITSGS